jgi:hypothetical protein
MAREIAIDGDKLTALAFAPHDWSLAVGTEGGKLHMFAMGRKEAVFTIGDADPVQSLAWSSDGKQLATISARRLVRVRSAADGSPLQTFDERPAHAVAYSPEGRWLAGIDRETKKLWLLDAQTWKASPAFADVPAQTYSHLVWSADSTRLAALDRHMSGSHYGRLDILTAGGEQTSLKLAVVEGVAWGPGDEHLVCVEPEGRIVMRDPDTAEIVWQVLTLPEGHTAILDRNGRLLDGDAAAVDKDLVYLVEQQDGRIDLHKHSEFMKLIGGKFPVATLPPARSSNPRPDGQFLLNFDGESSYVLVPRLAIDTSVEALTVESWVRPDQDQGIDPGIVIGGGQLGLICRGQEKEPRMKWQTTAGGADSLRHIFSQSHWQPDVATHVAAVYDGNEVRLYVDGKREASAPLTEGLTDEWGKHLCLGAAVSLDGPPPFNFYSGVIDEVRISNIARYDKDFTPQKRFEPDKHTLALYHFDEGQGDVLVDSSGHGHHGKIHGAKWVLQGGQ